MKFEGGFLQLAIDLNVGDGAGEKPQPPSRSGFAYYRQVLPDLTVEKFKV